MNIIYDLCMLTNLLRANPESLTKSGEASRHGPNPVNFTP